MISKNRASGLLGALLLVLSLFSVEEGIDAVHVLAASVGCQTVYSVHVSQHELVHVARCAGTVEEAAEAVLTSADGVKRALEVLQDGKVLRLDVAELVLDATLLINSSNVELRGRPGKTCVQCPSDDSALIIRSVASKF